MNGVVQGQHTSVNIDRSVTHSFTVYGPIPSKKNQYTPRKGGMFKDSALQAELNALEEQIPGNVRDLQLEHPDIVFRFCSKHARRDKDGMVTTMLDLMKRCGVIVDDNLKHCNGTWTIMPVEIGEHDGAEITLYSR